MPQNPYWVRHCKVMLKIVTTIDELHIEELLRVYQEDILESENSFISYLREDFFHQKGSFYALWVVSGQYKAALRMEPYNDGLLLEALCTVPSERRKGYGYLLVAEVLKYLMIFPYKVVYSHIDKKNIASLKLHRKCGFRLFSEFARYIDGTVTQNSCTMYYEL